MPTKTCCAHKHVAGEDQRSSILAAAKKVRTQMDNVVQMLEKGEYCPTVLQQALSVQGMWKGMIRRIFVNHLRTCFSQAVVRGDRAEQERLLQEIAHVMELADRS